MNENDIEVVIHGTDRSGQAFDSAESRAEGFSSKIGGMFSKMGPMLATGALAAGAVAGAALIKGVQGAMEKESTQDKMAAQLGGSPEFQERMGAVAGKLYANAFGDSLADASEAVRNIWQSGLVPEDTTAEGIEKITEKVMNLSTAFDQDLQQTARAAAKMIKTGMAGDADEALDILTRGFQETGDQAGDLLDTFSEYSTKFRDLGLSGQQAMGLISQGLKGGARDADTVADALKEFAIRAVDGSKTTADGFKAIGLNGEKMASIFAKGGPEAAKGLDTVLDRIRAMKDPVEREAAAVALFGTKAEDLGDALLKMDPSAAIDALGQVGGAASKMGDTLNDNAAAKLESFKRGAMEKLTDFGARAIELFEKVASSPQVQEFVNTLKEDVLPILERLGKFIQARIIPVFVMLFEDYLSKGVEAFHELQDVIKENEKELNQLGNFLRKIADFILDKVVPVIGPIFTDSLKLGIRLISMFIAQIGRWIRAFNSVRTAVTAVVSWVVSRFNSMLSFFSTVRGRLAGVFTGAFDGIKSALRSALNWVVDKWNNFRIPGLQTPFGQIGGIETPNIGYFAAGGIASGLAAVSRHEVMALPRGTRVFPEGNTASMMGQGSGVVRLELDPSLTGPAKDLMEIIVRNLRYKIGRESGGSAEKFFGRRIGVV